MNIVFKPLSKEKAKALGRVTGLLILALVALGSYVLALAFLGIRSAFLVEEGVSYRQKEAHEQYLFDVGKALLATKAEQKTLESYFVDEKTVVDFLGNSEAIGRRLGLEVDTTSLGVRDGILRVEIQATGAYPEIIHFMALIETLPQKLSLPEIAMSFSNGRWVTRLSLDVHSFREQP